MTFHLDNPIARITAAIILVFSLLAVTGVIGDVNPEGARILDIMIGASITFLFVAQAKRTATTG